MTDKDHTTIPRARTRRAYGLVGVVLTGLLPLASVVALPTGSASATMCMVDCWEDDGGWQGGGGLDGGDNNAGGSDQGTGAGGHDGGRVGGEGYEGFTPDDTAPSGTGWDAPHSTQPEPYPPNSNDPTDPDLFFLPGAPATSPFPYPCTSGEVITGTLVVYAGGRITSIRWVCSGKRA